MYPDSYENFNLTLRNTYNQFLLKIYHKGNHTFAKQLFFDSSIFFVWQLVTHNNVIAPPPPNCKQIQYCHTFFNILWKILLGQKMSWSKSKYTGQNIPVRVSKSKYTGQKYYLVKKCPGQSIPVKISRSECPSQSIGTAGLAQKCHRLPLVF